MIAIFLAMQLASGGINQGITSEPLRCGEYQHVQHWPGPCGPSICDETSGTCLASCTIPPPDVCVEDTRMVTEREWQELLKRIQKLEERLSAASPKAGGGE